MPQYINASGNYQIEGYGVVHINVRADAKTMRVHWKGGRLHVYTRTGTTLDRLIAFLDQFSEKLQTTKPDTPYYIGQHLEYPGLAIDIQSQSHAPDRMLANFESGKGTLLVGTNWDFSDHNTIRTISRFICRMASSVAPDILLPRAREIAAILDKQPIAWTISNGHRTLGHCSPRGVIALSYALVFYPDNLRDYVVCHELAHLSEMNHSPRFHEIADAYALRITGLPEAQLTAAMRAVKTPII